MAITITSASQITVTGGSAATPLKLDHLTTLANWPAGTTQATVDGYITRTGNSYTWTIQPGKMVILAGYLDVSDATVVSKSTGSYIHTGPGGVLTGGRIVAGKVFARPTWIFDVGAFPGTAYTAPSITTSFLSGNGSMSLSGLRLINNSQQPGAAAGHTSFVFWADTGTATLPQLELLSEGNSPVYGIFGSNTAGSSTTIKECRIGTIRHFNTNFSVSFGDGGWIGGDDGGLNLKLLVPLVQNTYTGLAPVFESANNYFHMTSRDFTAFSVILKNCYVDAGRVTVYPNDSNNRVEILRTLNFGVTDTAGGGISNFTVRAVARATSTVKTLAKFSTGGSADIRVWLGVGGGGSTLPVPNYRYPTTITDERTVDIVIRHPEFAQSTLVASGELGPAALTATPARDAAMTVSADVASAITGVSFAIAGGLVTVTVSEAKTLQDIYNAWRWWVCQPAQMTVDMGLVRVVGKVLTVTGGLSASAAVTAGAAVTTINASGAVSGTVNVPYTDTSGQVVSITGLDPAGFGVTGNLRISIDGGATWRETRTYTGSSITAKVPPGSVMTVQARTRGYAWAQATLDTAATAALDMGLTADRDLSGVLIQSKPFDAALVGKVVYDYAADYVTFANPSGALAKYDFATLYQVIQGITHVAPLCWALTKSVIPNGTRDGLIVETGNPLRARPSADSTAGIHLDCTVTHQATGQPVFDRLRGNASGYQITLAVSSVNATVEVKADQLAGVATAVWDHSALRNTTAGTALALVKETRAAA